MYTWERWIAIPLIGAFIGWTTNILAIRLLFRPHRQVRVLFWTLQGVIPARRAEIAASVARVVDKDLLPLREIAARLHTPALEDRITSMIIDIARRRLLERLPAFFPAGLKDAVSRAVEDTLRREIPRALRELEEEFTSAAAPLSLGRMVAEKFNNLDLKNVEKIILEVAGRELRYIELLGGILGLIIGLVQAALAGW